MNTAKPQLVQALGPLMMAPEGVAMIESLLASQDIDNNPETRMVQSFMRDITDFGDPYSDYDSYYNAYPVIVGSTLIIPIHGALLQNDTYRSPGTNTIARWYQRASIDPSITEIIEYVNCVGGSVFGIQELADAKLACKKPVDSYVTGYCVSAALWFISASHKVYATSDNCFFGGIGAKYTYQDESKYMEERGIKTEVIYSDTAPKKDNHVREAKKGNFKPFKTMANDVDANFMAFIKSRRPAVTAEALEGDVFITQKAIAQGICDGVQSFNNYLSTTKSELEMSKSIGKFFASIAGLHAGENTEEDVTVATAELQTENQTLTASLQAEKDAKAAAEQLAADAQARIATLKAAHAAEKAELEAKIRNQDAPAVLPTDPKSVDEPLATAKPVILDPLTAQIKADLEAYEVD